MAKPKPERASDEKAERRKAESGDDVLFGIDLEKLHAGAVDPVFRRLIGAPGVPAKPLN